MSDMNIEVEIAMLKTNNQNISAQLLEVKEEIKVLNRLVTSVEKIAMQTDSTAKKVDNIDSRLEKIESEPKSRLTSIRNSITSTIVAGVLGTLIGAVMALILKTTLS